MVGDGSQSFRYRLADVPVAGATVDIGHVAVTVALRLDGELVVRATAAAADGRVRALAAVREVAAGVMVGGIGSAEARIAAGADHRFAQRGRVFHAPDTVAFTGDCEIGFTRGDVRVTGRARYRLDVSALPHREPERAPWDGSPDARAWFTRHDHELSAIGVLVLVAVPFTPGALLHA
ncbi:hypothetical protein [Actinokineospora sp. NBRC 105648]|uniref:hypothetical protein n=1 Tax=Actinokineospora sp. NBRC 105648 TaxID=3032206 RepID=UPI0024A22C4B|nr:hypothetical protein [Actinokineospora sp. NBRC 105648]GLZ39447.1 hypothetical protein Acsp05_30710 [Actinokineospora sp. NBRC 105648]